MWIQDKKTRLVYYDGTVLWSILADPNLTQRWSNNEMYKNSSTLKAKGSDKWMNTCL